MAKGPTWDQVHDPKLANRVVHRPTPGWTRKESHIGKSRVLIHCPFCNWAIWVYLWSFAARGKRRDCGALLGSQQSHHFADKIKGGTDA